MGGGSFFTATTRAGTLSRSTIAVTRSSAMGSPPLGISDLTSFSCAWPVAASTEGKRTLVTVMSRKNTVRAAVSTSVFALIEATPSAGLPPFGVKESAIRHLSDL
jgi:hypothetical protein